MILIMGPATTAHVNPDSTITDINHINGKPPSVTAAYDDCRPIMDIEQALQLTKFGKFNYCLIVISGIVMTTALTETVGMGYAMPVADCDLNLNTTRRGILGAIGFAGIICSSHLWGFLADTQGRRRIIVPTLIAAFLFTLLSSVTTNYFLFVVFRFLNGFFLSGSSAVIYAYLGEFHTLEYRSRAITGASIIYGVGCMAQPINAWLVINQTWEFYIPFIDVMYKPWRLFLVTSGLPGLMCAVALIQLPESPKFVLSQQNQPKTIAILQRMHRINNGIGEGKLEISSITEEVELNSWFSVKDSSSQGVSQVLRQLWNQTTPIFKPPYLKRTFIACTLQFCISITATGLYIWYPEIMNRINDFMVSNPGQKNSLCKILDVTKNDYAVNGQQHSTEIRCLSQFDISTYAYGFALDIFYFIGFILIGMIIKKTGEIPILSSTVTFCGICGLLALYVNLPSVIPFLLVGLFVCGIVTPLASAVTVNLYPTTTRGMAISIAVMISRLGSITGTNLFALLIDSYCGLSFMIASLSLILCGFVSIFLKSSSKA